MAKAVYVMRIDIKLKYLAELVARKQRRSLSSFIECSIEQALANVAMKEHDGTNGPSKASILDEAEDLWDLDSNVRLLKLAKHHPELMTYDEQLAFKKMTS